MQSTEREPETPGEAYDRLLRETRLSDQIAELQEALDAAGPPPVLGYMFTGTQLRIVIDQLHELRARRVAMGRDPDDELNATADLDACRYCGLPGKRPFDGCIATCDECAAEQAEIGHELPEGGVFRPELPRLPDGAPQIQRGLRAGTLAYNDGRAKCGLRLDACPYQVPDLESCSGCNYEPAEGP